MIVVRVFIAAILRILALIFDLPTIILSLMCNGISYILKLKPDNKFLKVSNMILYYLGNIIGFPVILLGYILTGIILLIENTILIFKK